MPKKHEDEDTAFMAEFARQLTRQYDAARNSGVRHQQFADSLDVSRTTLQEYLDGKRVPSVRSLALAVHHYKIDIGYDGTDFRASSKNRKRSDTGQLSFPFLLVSPSNKVMLKLGPATENTITIDVQIKRKTG
jgi:transcriptional regulator with XRE-family HTH domain